MSRQCAINNENIRALRKYFTLVASFPRCHVALRTFMSFRVVADTLSWGNYLVTASTYKFNCVAKIIFSLLRLRMGKVLYWDSVISGKDQNGNVSFHINIFLFLNCELRGKILFYCLCWYILICSENKVKSVNIQSHRRKTLQTTGF